MSHRLLLFLCFPGAVVHRAMDWKGLAQRPLNGVQSTNRRILDQVLKEKAWEGFGGRASCQGEQQ